MKKYNISLTCQHCGYHLGKVTIEDIEQPSIITIQCALCGIDEDMDKELIKNDN